MFFNMFKSKKKFIAAYFECFDFITAELDGAADNTKQWLVANGMEKFVGKINSLMHPIPDEFKFNAGDDPKENIIMCVAQDWRNPLKGGTLLAEVFAETLLARENWSLEIIGEHGEKVIAAKILKRIPHLAPRIRILGKMPATQTREHYQKAKIIAIGSHSEGVSLCAFEAACTGCSVVFSSKLRQLFVFEKNSAGTMAAKHSVAALSEAVLCECSAWDIGERDPVRISATFGHRAWTSKCCEELLELAKSPPN
jgi:Glycosyltransferase